MAPGEACQFGIRRRNLAIEIAQAADDAVEIVIELDTAAEQPTMGVAALRCAMSEAHQRPAEGGTTADQPGQHRLTMHVGGQPRPGDMKRNGETGPWDAAFEQLQSWDPDWANLCRTMSTGPWYRDILPRRFAELVSIGLNAACTNLDRDGTRRHIRAALAAGTTRDEILVVLKMASVVSIHSCTLGAPILLEEAAAAGLKPPQRPAEPTPASDRMRAAGQWNTAWDPFVALDPSWTDAFMAVGMGIYGGGTFTPKEVELLSIAFDASFTHMYAPGTRRNIKAALAVGATVEEVMEVLKLCVVQGVQACNLAVPILVEELERAARPEHRP